MATKFFWALGYNQVETFLTTFDPARVKFDPEATIHRPNGKRTPFTRDDLDAILERVARRPDGTYRVVAGRLLPGKSWATSGTKVRGPTIPTTSCHTSTAASCGPWRVRRLDQPDRSEGIEHPRHPRGENGRWVVKHWLQDVGSTFGMSNDLHEWDLELGALLSGEHTSGGCSRSVSREPVADREVRGGTLDREVRGRSLRSADVAAADLTTAYMELRDDDAFWAARRVGAFTDEMIRAIIHTGEFSDAAAEKARRHHDQAPRQDLAGLPAAVNPVSPQMDARVA